MADSRFGHKLNVTLDNRTNLIDSWNANATGLSGLNRTETFEMSDFSKSGYGNQERHDKTQNSSQLKSVKGKKKALLAKVLKKLVPLQGTQAFQTMQNSQANTQYPQSKSFSRGPKEKNKGELLSTTLNTLKEPINTKNTGQTKSRKRSFERTLQLSPSLIQSKAFRTYFEPSYPSPSEYGHIGRFKTPRNGRGGKSRQSPANPHRLNLLERPDRPPSLSNPSSRPHRVGRQSKPPSLTSFVDKDKIKASRTLPLPKGLPKR